MIVKREDHAKARLDRLPRGNVTSVFGDLRARCKRVLPASLSLRRLTGYWPNKQPHSKINSSTNLLTTDHSLYFTISAIKTDFNYPSLPYSNINLSLSNCFLALNNRENIFSISHG